MDEKNTYEMGLVGNCAFISYIDKSANVTWQCWPRFDSSFIFGSLLDQQKGGEFYVRPAEDDFQSRQWYVENTNVLVTEFTSATGSFEVVDFAPRFSLFERFYKPLMLMRKVRRIEGDPRIKVACRPKGGYGEISPNVSFGSNHIRYQGLEDSVRLTTNIPLNYIMTTNPKPILLTETKYMVLSWGAPFEAPLENTVESFLQKTVDYWQTWVEHCSIPSIFQKETIRSALALKLHQFEDTGAIIASGTTSLPEAPNSGRNWDYRYFWVRDCFYTLNAFFSLGQMEELNRYSHFIRNIVAEAEGRYQPMFGIAGERELDERTLDLKGYKGNQPVRVGNAAYTQVQNDVYGQIILSLLPLYVDARISESKRLIGTDLVRELLGLIELKVDESDAGVWEFREAKKPHCYTFLFHWAGAAAAEKIGHAVNDVEIHQRAQKVKRVAAEKIEACYNPKIKAYASFVGGDQLDASLFQLITMRYLDPKSERAKNHLQALEKELQICEGQFYRYKHEDDFGKPEVAFVICGFWYVEALCLLGEVKRAQAALKELFKVQNHLGLMSEDFDPKTGSQWGNFPQTYSHVGLVNATFALSEKLSRPYFL